mgnify:CR=1 FL=1
MATLVLREIIRAARPDYEEWAETLVLSLVLAALFTPLLNMALNAVGASGPLNPMRYLEIAAVVVIVPIGVTMDRQRLLEGHRPVGEWDLDFGVIQRALHCRDDLIAA